MRQEIHEVTIQDIENDLFLVTGDRGLAKAQAHAFSIHYRGEIIDSVKYKRGFISADDLIYSRHVRWEHMKKHAQKLAANMAKAGRGDKPKNTAAHHIVSWNDMRAARSRLRLAAFGIDIDHEANGVYLPRFQKHVPMDILPDAYPHSKVHTGKYYFNIEFLLNETIAEGLGRQGIIETLKEIGEELADGTFPITTLLTQGNA
ncbi:AHH domain-containing protein [Pseudoalteromonas carrageenovora]|uniref:AHH domain-containing protein n=1 Tax=Pseudoalteromonas TaxID=53246 RepID=UPI00160089A8|nr:MULTISPECIES: AHH domain-containing protein [Pseudoalteromonas]MBB1450069.1 AHH domain-containing protein [Pseudoalteromonas sp. SG43-1]MCQ8888254.1 AHH domain-containing protein [Pseudoalteromonas carrageenovora]